MQVLMSLLVTSSLTLYAFKEFCYQSAWQKQWREHRMGVIWQDLGALTTVRAREFYICWRRDNWDLWSYSGYSEVYECSNIRQLRFIPGLTSIHQLPLPLLHLLFTPNLITVITSTIDSLSINYPVSSRSRTLLLVLSLKLWSPVISPLSYTHSTGSASLTALDQRRNLSGRELFLPTPTNFFCQRWYQDFEQSGRCWVKCCVFWQVGFWVWWARIQS